MSRFASIDLSQLPAPEVVETLEFEALLTRLKDRLTEALPEVAPVLALESEPLTKLLELLAYAELILRARVNDGAKAVMLSHAQGGDLDQLSALLGVARLTVTPADETTVPITPAVMERDAVLRARTQLALEGFTSAGSRGAYEFHARSADARVADVSVTSPEPGQVRVAILWAGETPTPPEGLLEVVSDVLNAPDVRPLCFSTSVIAAELVPVEVTASLQIATGPDASAVEQAARTALERYFAATRALGAVVARSGILAALHQPGVIAVSLTSPAADVICTALQAPNAAAITLELA